MVTGFAIPFTINTDYFPLLMASAFRKSRAPSQLCHFPRLINYSQGTLLSSPDSDHPPGLGVLGSCCYDCVCLPIWLIYANKSMHFISGGDLPEVN